MYINYNKLIDLGIFKFYFYKKKIEQNLTYIEKNKAHVIKKLRMQKHFKVVFYVYDCAKWKCQSLYELMNSHPNFSPLIVVTRNAVKNIDNPSYQTKENVLKTLEFFKSKGMNATLGYDFEKDKHIPFKEFKPDIIIYQHPWYVETSQGPVVSSKFALTAYVPYDIPTTKLQSDYNLRFHNYVENYFVFNEKLKEYYSERMDNKGKNLIVTGTPALDYFITNPPVNEKQYVIYAPHWTVNHKNTIAYSTFKETGKFILDYAKQNPQFNWVFKPHPMLKKALIDNKIMTPEEVENYYDSWKESCFDGDYFKYFNDSQLMITDCSTFLLEYAVTGKPLIRPVSKDMTEFNTTTEEVVKNYYNVETTEDLKKYLDMILKEKSDPLKENRKSFKNKNSAEKIILYLEKILTF